MGGSSCRCFMRGAPLRRLQLQTPHDFDSILSLFTLALGSRCPVAGGAGRRMKNLFLSALMAWSLFLNATAAFAGNEGPQASPEPRLPPQVIAYVEIVNG